MGSPVILFKEWLETGETGGDDPRVKFGTIRIVSQEG